MRPIALSVSGLQSFRENQTIPFDELCSGGVFGIFGPTGSGKSTILDAVTLALYGKVERAAGGTHGIMNQAEDKLSVSFSFQLGQNDQEKYFTVERSYKRSGEYTIRTSTSRLIETVNGESVVHADKERDVTRLVQELIGLTIEDFTRAVVLPQGKFAEFLSLKGADRRQMLQRLFQLEKYGDVLNQKLKKRSDNQRNRLNEITAEQAGLGDASKSSLNEAEKLLKDNEAMLQTVSDRLKKEEDHVKTLQILWETQTENEKLLNDQEDLLKLKPEMERLKQQLQFARSADKLQPYAKEWQESVKTESKISAEKEELHKRTQKLKSAMTDFEQQYEFVKKEKDEEEPRLIEKKSGLKEAFDWENEGKEKKHTLKKEKEKHEELLKGYEELQKSETDAAQVLKKGKDKQALLKTELSTIEITSKERAMFQQALLIFQRFQDVDAEEKKLQNELKSANKELIEVEQNKKQLENVLAEEYKQGKTLSLDVQCLYEEVCSAVRENEQMTQSLQNELAITKKNHEQNRIKHLAAQLSSQLKENEPCAVCGSTVHPSPIQEWSRYDDEQSTIDDLEAAKEILNRLYHDLHHMKDSLEKLSANMWNKFQGESVIETAAARDSITIESAGVIHGFEKDQIDKHATRVKGIQQDRIAMEQRYDALLSRLDEEQKQFERLEFDYRNGERQTERLKLELSAIQKKKSNLNLEWESAAIPFSKEDLTLKHQQFQTRDARQTAIQKSLDVAVEFLEKQSDQLESAQKEKTKLELAINTSLNQQMMIQKEIDALQEKIQKRIGNKAASEEYETVEMQLRGLQTKYKRAEEDQEKAKSLFLECDKAYHSIIQRLEDIQERRTKAEEEWNKQLDNSDFTSYDEYASSMTDEQNQQSWELELTRYTDQLKANEAALFALKDKLPREKITKDQMDFREVQLQKLKDETNSAREAVGQARQNWLTIERNHSRFQELEEEKKKVSTLLEQIGKLQSVFRGNAFVEFMAEEQLMHVTRDASSRLSKLTRGRYAIEVDSNSGFVIRDDANGGIKRPVTSLSGGETFLTSLALALALSAQIQLRGKFPLQFFFLDEGFGTLDQELLDTVVTALEKVRVQNFAIGVISHVPELKARLTKRLIVEPAEHSGNGTRVRLDQG
ncbi:AAA family ATPase [Fictibacillus nanhaiensis]|uniref:AAA family ATPase n=1 Tax=Fictibacillus nanhaiensis TaxID=742169 RepID=UPI001C939937|nr:AAA family ATPase [Fictibacillus nanhaiensis]MBY6036397.1 AAA family ATPase [Fictibacillus nanhaiensis]